LASKKRSKQVKKCQNKAKIKLKTLKKPQNRLKKRPKSPQNLSRRVHFQAFSTYPERTTTKKKTVIGLKKTLETSQKVPK
jgi:hypothetical protein